MGIYEDFLSAKLPRAAMRGQEIDEATLPEALFDFQRHCAAFAVAHGAAGIYLDTGLGKTAIELAYAQAVSEIEGGAPVLILAPLAVAPQIVREGARFGIPARPVREAAEVRPGINVCNYDRLHKIDPAAFVGVVLDEASILKSFNGKTTRALIEAFRGHRWRMAATATPAPNDHMELGQQAEFLGVMESNEMLMRWFIADQTQMGRYRLKAHGERDFWDWMASWARLAQSPEDMGFDGARYVLPALKVEQHRTYADVRPIEGMLFAADVSATAVHDIKRQTTAARADVVAALVSAEPAEAWVIWCDTDYEADALAARLCKHRMVEVRGSMSIEQKEASLDLFSSGQANIMVTKPSICGYGLNWQHAARMAFVGRSFSYESWYQAVRRCWRFGQTRPVHVHIAVAEGEDQIGTVIDRKAGDHLRMKRAMTEAMFRARGLDRSALRAYNPTHLGRLPTWLQFAV
jgi:hypothetical protein